ncbi:MerR family transcriptional regulator [Bacillus sp. CRN 9]|nr:MerR family transcriptional regulator [Bacillus sp. CRN 9]
MEYTIKKVAEMSGVSARTLRYYDEIGLLKPARINSSGYRIYSQNEIDRLQQILFYRSLEMKLDDIQELLSSPDFDVQVTLQSHYKQLVTKRVQIEQLIQTVEKTLRHHKGEISMSNKEKFVGFKKEKLAENESKYGKEIREKYGEETVEASNKKWMNMSEDDYNKMQSIETELFIELENLSQTGDLESEAAKNVYKKHKEWLQYSWNSYSAEAHIGLANMYVADERFAQYYNERAGKAVVELLRNSIVKYAK